MSNIKTWVKASRPHSFGASIAPVLIGLSLAYHVEFHPLIAILTLLCALLVHAGTNYANDYFDYMNGIDTEEGNDELRVSEGGIITPKSLKRVFISVFALTFLLGIYLMFKGGLPIIIIGVSSILIGILYTGGKMPLSYIGLGDLLVLIFFGIVAVCGTYYLQTGTVTFDVFIASLAPGALSIGILAVNNIRDIDTDRAGNKKTAAVRFGRNFVRAEYILAMLTAIAVSIYFFLNTCSPLMLAPGLIVLLNVRLIKKIFTYKDPKELNATLAGTAQLLLMYSLLFVLAQVIRPMVCGA